MYVVPEANMGEFLINLDQGGHLFLSMTKTRRVLKNNRI